VPTYQYACTECADRLEVVQKFTDEPLTVCAACGGKLRKIFSPVGIVFKGSGFYRTDSRASQKAGAAANGSGGADGKKSDAASSGDKPGTGDKKSGDKVGSSSSSSGSGSGSGSSGSGSGSSGSASGSGSGSGSGSKVA